MLLGSLSGTVSFPEEIKDPPPDGSQSSGKVCSVREFDATRYMVVDNRGTKIQLSVASLLPDVLPGDSVYFSGEWTNTKRKVNFPLDDDGQSVAWRKGISLRCRVNAESLTVKPSGQSLAKAIFEWHNHVNRIIYRSNLTEGAMLFLSTMITGDSDMMDETTRKAFASAGVAHVLALSGTHIAIIASVISLFLLPFTFFGMRRIKWLITIVLLWGFAAFTGFSPSVTRSAIMASVVLFGLFLDRNRSGLNALCLAGILILCFNPVSLWQPGFQLSFAATAAILLIAPFLYDIPIKNKLVRWAAISAGVTLSATIATAPLSCYWFHEFPLLFIAGNFVALLLLPALLGTGVFIVLFGILNWSSAWLEAAFDLLYSLLDGAVTAIASLGWKITGMWFDAWLLIPIYIGLALLYMSLRLQSRKYCYAGMSAVTLTVIVPIIFPGKVPQHEVIVSGNPYCTQIVVRTAENASVYLLGRNVDAESDSVYFTNRHSKWLASRRIRDIRFIECEKTNNCPDLVSANGKSLKTISSFEDANIRDSATYVLLLKKPKGITVEKLLTLNADTAIIPQTIYYKAAELLCDSLRKAHIPVKLLSEGEFVAF